MKTKQIIILVIVALVFFIIGRVVSPSGNSNNSEVNHSEHHHEGTVWTCSMHPQIRQDEPGKCPICGMDLIPAEDSKPKVKKETVDPHEITFTEDAIKLAEIKTDKVKKAIPQKEIKLLGKVAPNETKLYTQTSHISGRIERLYVNFTGEKISKGQKLASVYSPQLTTAQKELLEAYKSKDNYPELYEAAYNKLKLWKLTDAQIEKIIASGEVEETIDILSDYNGIVMDRKVELGNHIMEGQPLFQVADLSTVWVLFEAYETDLQWLKNGQKLKFEVASFPGKKMEGKITFIEPFVDPKTRSTFIRVELVNKGMQLLPGMFATGEVNAGLQGNEPALIIPKSAVLWTGERSVVYVQVPHQDIISFEYREIDLGADLGNSYIVLKGLMEGEVIATNGVFRIDASAQLSGKKSMMNEDGASAPVHDHSKMKM